MNAKIVVKKTIFKAFVKTNLKRIIIKGVFSFTCYCFYLESF